MRRPRSLPSLLALASACALALALVPAAAQAGYSDGSIPDAIAACEGGPYDIIERDGDLYVACHGTTLDWMRFSADAQVDGAVARVTLSRTGAGSGRRTLIRYQTSDGTAQAGRDYTPQFGQIYFDDLETSKTLEIPLIDDPAATEPRAFTVRLEGSIASQGIVIPAQREVTLPFATPDGPAPAVSGRARVGETLTASAGPWAPAADSVGWQWERCDADGSACVDVDDATSATLLVGAHAGARLRVRAEAVNAAGTTTLRSALTDVVRPALAPPAIVSAPPATTTARSAAFSFTGEAGAAFECRLDAGAWAACTSPRTFTGLPLGPRSFDVRQTADDGAISAAASYGWTVEEEPPSASAPPAVGGAARVGQTLTATGGTWSPAPTTAAFAWLRCDAAGSGCTQVATGATYALGPGDAGARMRVRETATGAGGSDSADSAATAVVRIALAVPSVDLAPPAETTAREARIVFSGEAGATFECALDGGGWAPCGSPLELTGLALGARAVEIRQLADDGVVSAAARVAWTVRAEPEPRPEPRPDPRPEPRPEPEPRSQPQPQPEPRREPQPSAKPKPGATKPGAGKPAPRPRGRRVVTTVTLRYCAGCARPAARERAILRRLRARVRGAELLRVVGHADRSGDAADNTRLAGERARIVARLLLPRGRGAAAARPRAVEVRNAGARRPVAANDTLAGRAQNRRVTIRLVTRR